jgi:lycopene cyclase domain-containing protein
MKKHIYALIALLSFAGPFAMSFDRKVYFIQYLPAIAIATLSIGALYIIWDVFVTRAGHWRFNDETVGSFRIAHLPVGEWLFFLLIPYPSIFIYEVVAAYFPATQTAPDTGLAWLHFVLAGLFTLLAIPARKRGYTMLAMVSAAIYFAASGIFTPGVIAVPGYLLSMGLIFIAFIVINGLYTSIPTIFYSDTAILGIRAGSIPLEDFVYNLSYIGLSLTVYLEAKLLLGL